MSGLLREQGTLGAVLANENRAGRLYIEVLTKTRRRNGGEKGLHRNEYEDEPETKTASKNETKRKS
jgi:hypothetical protein